MRESVRKPKQPWLVVVVLIAIGVLYFVLLGKSDFPEPGPNLSYDIEEYIQLDRVETRFEESESIETGLEYTRAMAVGPDGKIYVGGADAVAVFDSDGAELARFDVVGNPTSMTISANGTLFLGMRDHIEVFSSNGELQDVWEELGPRALLTSLVASEDHVFAADAGNRVVLRYGRDGTLQGRIGEADPERDIPGIVVPSPYLDVAFDEYGTLWVVNPGMMGLENYRDNGDLISSWYKPSMKLEGFSGCCNPSHIAFDADGRLITLDKGMVRIKVYVADTGEFEELVAGTRIFESAQALKDLAVDSRNRILVLDGSRNAVRVFDLKEQT